MAKHFPHLKLNVKNVRQLDKFKYKTRDMSPKPGSLVNQEEEPEQPIDYPQKTENFRRSLVNLENSKALRLSQRNPELRIPTHIDYIKVNFHGQFDINKFFTHYYNHYGLLAVNFTKFNTVVLFAVIEEAKFLAYLQQLHNFVNLGNSTNYDRHILYIESFELHSTNDILQLSFAEYPSLVKMHLADFPLYIGSRDIILKSLFEYLQQRGINNQLNPITQTLEVENIDPDTLVEVVNNFDIVQSVTSSLTTVIAPSVYQQPQRSYGFDIVPPDESTPIIGVIDTGISSATPLSSILINDDRFDTTGTSPFIDNADHGTGIAGLAALGRFPYSKGYRGTFNSDARLLSIKILDGCSGNISDTEVLKLLRQAKAVYPTIKIFTLTICYSINKKDDEEISRYAYELDRFAYENDCLIFICTSNNNHAATNSSYDCGYFDQHHCNIAIPAESMNNITIGAAAESFRAGPFMGISPSKEFPTLFTRKYHVDLSKFFSGTKINKRLFKPDVIEAGGDYELHRLGFIGVGEAASIEIISSDPSRSFCYDSGTSYSAPLTANIAAKILKRYPDLRAQTLKALIVNSSSLQNISLSTSESMTKRLVGHGLVNQEKALFSNPNAATIVLEDSISPGIINIYPINLPEYFTNQDLGKKFGIIRITATLTFSFLPQPNNQLAYCPIMMAFSIFRNKEIKEITNAYEDALLRERWTQDGYFKTKPKVNSNVHKISFQVGTKELLSEENTFKIAINCSLGNQILPEQKRHYDRDHKFSLVITVEEMLKPNKLTGKLYEELVNVNDVEVLTILDADVESDLDAEA